MAKSIFLVLAITFAFAAAGTDDSCPDAKDIAPCTCDGEGANCMGKITLAQIQKAFSANFKYGGVRSIWIQGTPIESIPANIIGKLKVQEVYIEMNNATTVDLKFLEPSASSLTILSFYGNRISEVDLSYFGKFARLFILNLGRNELTKIPKGFKSWGLNTLILAQNKITEIGANVFNEMQNLQRLELGQNRLKTLGPNSLSLIAPNAVVNLAYNQISTVSPKAFEGSNLANLILAANQLTSFPYDSFGTLVTRMGRRGGAIDVSGNPFSCKGCEFGWLVDNKRVLSFVLLGFLCEDRTTLPQMTRRQIGC